MFSFKIYFYVVPHQKIEETYQYDQHGWPEYEDGGDNPTAGRAQTRT